MVFVETSFPRGGIAKPQLDESSGAASASKKEEKMVILKQLKSFIIYLQSILVFADIWCGEFAKREKSEIK